MSSRLLSFVIWATVAASAAYWGLRLFTRPTPVPGQAVLASANPPPGGDLTRLLGAPPPPPPVAEVAALPADSRFKLVGVVAPRAGQPSGLALISVDGKPAHAYLVGRELEPGLRLLAVGHRQAELGAQGGLAALKLELPPLPEAARGTPGEAAAPGMPPAGLPPPGLVLPGVPPQPGLLQQPGQPAGYGAKAPAARFLPGMGPARLPGVPPGLQVAPPGVLMQPALQGGAAHDPVLEQQADINGAQAR